jgi:hypothetical protein
MTAPIPTVPTLSNADAIRAIRRMTVTELADTLATIHQTYSTELQGDNS